MEIDAGHAGRVRLTFRKQKAKLEKEKQADINRRLHGRTKAERVRDLKQKQALDSKVDGARLQAPPDSEE